jgi:hypothetical protein
MAPLDKPPGQVLEFVADLTRTERDEVAAATDRAVSRLVGHRMLDGLTRQRMRIDRGLRLAWRRLVALLASGLLDTRDLRALGTTPVLLPKEQFELLVHREHQHQHHPHQRGEPRRDTRFGQGGFYLLRELAGVERRHAQR